MPLAAPETVTWKEQLEPAAKVPPDRTIVVGGVVVRVPPQTEELPPATVRPVGRLSVRVTPVSASGVLGLVIVKVSTDVALRAMLPGLKDFAIEGGAMTSIVADAVPPLPPSVEVTLPEVLILVPAVLPVTLTMKLQEAPAGTLEPVRLKLLALAVTLLDPVQVPPTPGGLAITRPVGRLSVKLTPVSAVVLFGLAIRKVRGVVPPTGMVGAPKALLMVGGASTVTDAREVLPAPPWLELTWTELSFTPAAVPITLTEKVQPAADPRVAPDRLTLDEPGAAEMVPLSQSRQDRSESRRRAPPAGCR